MALTGAFQGFENVKSSQNTYASPNLGDASVLCGVAVWLHQLYMGREKYSPCTLPYLLDADVSHLGC